MGVVQAVEQGEAGRGGAVEQHHEQQAAHRAAHGAHGEGRRGLRLLGDALSAEGERQRRGGGGDALLVRVRARVRVRVRVRVSVLTSSTTSTRHSCHRREQVRFFFTLASSSLSFSLARPTPAKECTVVPPMWQAAIPVEAVIMTDSSPYRPCSALMMRRSVNDLPVPAPPVRKIEVPESASSSACCCCWLRPPPGLGLDCLLPLALSKGVDAYGRF